MRNKIWIFSIGAAILLVLACFPTSVSEPLRIEQENEQILSSREMTWDDEIIKIKVIHRKQDGTLEESVKEISKVKHEAMMTEIKSTAKAGLTLREVFEEKLQIIKDYGLVPDDLTLEDILDVTKLTEPIEENNGSSFSTGVAPIFFVGGGFGFGIGFPFILTTGWFFLMLFGFGLVVAYDFAEKVLHQLFTLFFIPMLVGVCAGFMGLLLLPILPGFFYSNLVGLGIVAKTNWRFVPAMNLSL